MKTNSNSKSCILKEHILWKSQKNLREVHKAFHFEIYASNEIFSYNLNENKDLATNKLAYFKNHPTTEIRLFSFNKKFFYGLINYLQIYYLFKESLLKIFITLTLNFEIIKRKMSIKNFKNFNSINTFKTLQIIEFDYNFLKHYLTCFCNNDIHLKKTNFNNLKIVGVNLIEQDEIIRCWTFIVLSWLNKKLKYEGYWAFFSTLGGAYSSLGEESYEHAKNAENISIKQLSLAYAFNDPNAICRCKLFLSFSYIQLKKFNQAKFILRNEYKVLKSRKESAKLGVTDERLRVMCIAGLKKLKFSINNQI